MDYYRFSEANCPNIAVTIYPMIKNNGKRKNIYDFHVMNIEYNHIEGTDQDQLLFPILKYSNIDF